MSTWPIVQANALDCPRGSTGFGSFPQAFAYTASKLGCPMSRYLHTKMSGGTNSVIPEGANMSKTPFGGHYLCPHVRMSAFLNTAKRPRRRVGLCLCGAASVGGWIGRRINERETLVLAKEVWSY